MRNNSSKHSPNRYDKYLQIHLAYIERYIASGFVSDETLQHFYVDHQPFEICLRGQIGCLGRIVIDFNKSLEVLSGTGGNSMVQTFLYAYNVSVSGYGNVIRYDNSHPRKGHPDNHHKHEFDWRSNQQGEGEVIWIGEENWLTLGEVIEEAMNWYEKNQHELPIGFPTLGSRSA